MTYSSSLSVSRHRYAMRNQNTTSFRAEQRRIGPISNFILLAVLACILGLLYLTQVTKTNAYGYEINDLQTKQAQLADEKMQLELTSARLQSLERIKQSSVAAGMPQLAPSATLQN